MYDTKPDHHTPSLKHGDWITESLQIGVEDHWFVLSIDTSASSTSQEIIKNI